VFFGRRTRAPLIRGTTAGEQFLRFMALICVFIATGWLFWVNAEHSIEKIESRGTVVDLGDTLDAEQRQMLRDMGTLLKSEFGLELKVVISASHLRPPETNAKTVYIGVNPNTRRVEIQTPPLVSNALGPGLDKELAQRHILPGFANDTWPQGLLEAIEDLLRRLAALHNATSKEYRFQVSPEKQASE